MNRFDWLEINQRPNAAESAPAPVEGSSAYRTARRMRESGYFAEAIPHYQRAVGFDDQHYAARMEWVDTLVRAGRIQEADQVSYEAVNNYRQVRLLYASRALVLAHRGSLKEAYPLSDISLERLPSWYAQCVRAELLLKDSLLRREEVLDLLNKAVAMTNMPWEALFIGGLILLDAGWAPFAAGFFSEAVHANPRATAGYIYLGDCFKALRLYEQAMFYYQKAEEIEPKHALSAERQKARPLHSLT